MKCPNIKKTRVTLDNASDYQTNGLYRTPNTNPQSNPNLSG